MERTQKVAWLLQMEIIPCYVIPLTIGSENRTAFVAKVVQALAQGLKIHWKLYTAYCPQSSGKVEHMNQTLKLQLSKLFQKTHLK
jgi:hypothetical protein